MKQLSVILFVLIAWSTAILAHPGHSGHDATLMNGSHPFLGVETVIFIVAGAVIAFWVFSRKKN